MILDRVWVAIAVAELHLKFGLKQTELWLTTAEEDISTLEFYCSMQKQLYCLTFPILMIIFVVFAVMLSFVMKKQV